MDGIKELLRDFGCRTPLVGLAGNGGVLTPDVFIGQRDSRQRPSKLEWQGDHWSADCGALPLFHGTSLRLKLNRNSTGSDGSYRPGSDMPSLLFCGPKMAACGIVISIWGVIMLVGPAGLQWSGRRLRAGIVSVSLANVFGTSVSWMCGRQSGSLELLVLY